MASIDLSNYEALYIKTAYEYLDAMQGSLVRIRKNNEDTDAIDTLYRSGHSLKSQSSLMGYKNTASMNEFIEHTMKGIKEGKFPFTEKLFLELQTAIHNIEKSVNNIEKLHKELVVQDSAAN